jgi:polyisoprenoid-binding protein YceI
MNTIETGAATPRPHVDPASFVGRWTLDASRSNVTLRTRSVWGLVPVRATFDWMSGSAVVSPQNAVSGRFAIAASSINTKKKKRDHHLRSSDFLDVGAHPDIVFTVEDATASVGETALSGLLTVKGRPRPLTVPVQISSPTPDALVVDTEVLIDRADYGITTSPLGMASTKNVVAVRAVFTRE